MLGPIRAVIGKSVKSLHIFISPLIILLSLSWLPSEYGVAGSMDDDVPDNRTEITSLSGAVIVEEIDTIKL